MGFEHKAAKLFCDNPPTPTGDKCTDLLNMIHYHKQCVDMKEQWDNNWPHPEFPGGRHASDVADRRARAEKLKELYNKECGKNCP